MVSYNALGPSHRPHSKRVKKADFVGFYRQRVFGVSNPYNGTFSFTPTTTVSPKFDAPVTVHLRNFAVLIGDLPVLKLPFPILTRPQ
jgi:hypothetical protein